MSNLPEARLRSLLRRAHDVLCGTRQDTFADVSDIVDDIRVALDLDVADCGSCRTVMPAGDAVNVNGETFCRDCAEAQRNDLIPTP